MKITRGGDNLYWDENEDDDDDRNTLDIGNKQRCASMADTSQSDEPPL